MIDSTIRLEHSTKTVELDLWEKDIVMIRQSHDGKRTAQWKPLCSGTEPQKIEAKFKLLTKKGYFFTKIGDLTEDDDIQAHLLPARITLAVSYLIAAEFKATPPKGTVKRLRMRRDNFDRLAKSGSLAPIW